MPKFPFWAVDIALLLGVILIWAVSEFLIEVFAKWHVNIDIKMAWVGAVIIVIALASLVANKIIKMTQ